MFLRYQHEISLVLTDYGLPKMDGLKMFQRVRLLRQDAKFIMASVYFEPERKSEIFDAGIIEIVQKPYESIELFRKIREVIDADNGRKV